MKPASVMTRAEIESEIVDLRRAVRECHKEIYRMRVALICGLEKWGGTLEIADAEIEDIADGTATRKLHIRSEPGVGVYLSLGYVLAQEAKK